MRCLAAAGTIAALSLIAGPAGADVPIALGLVCQDWDTLSKIYEYMQAGDKEAAERLTLSAFLTGGCTELRAGEQIYVVDIGPWTHSVKVRPKGHTVEFWGILVGNAQVDPNKIGKLDMVGNWK
jgi:hypothetical protein